MGPFPRRHAGREHGGSAANGDPHRVLWRGALWKWLACGRGAVVAAAAECPREQKERTGREEEELRARSRGPW